MRSIQKLIDVIIDVRNDYIELYNKYSNKKDRESQITATRCVGAIEAYNAVLDALQYGAMDKLKANRN